MYLISLSIQFNFLFSISKNLLGALFPMDLPNLFFLLYFPVFLDILVSLALLDKALKSVFSTYISVPKVKRWFANMLCSIFLISDSLRLSSFSLFSSLIQLLDLIHLSLFPFLIVPSLLYLLGLVNLLDLLSFLFILWISLSKISTEGASSLSLTSLLEVQAMLLREGSIPTRLSP